MFTLYHKAFYDPMELGSSVPVFVVDRSLGQVHKVSNCFRRRLSEQPLTKQKQTFVFFPTKLWCGSARTNRTTRCSFCTSEFHQIMSMGQKTKTVPLNGLFLPYDFPFNVNKTKRVLNTSARGGGWVGGTDAPILRQLHPHLQN